MTNTTIKIRKNASRKLQALHLEAVKYEIETHSTAIDDSMNSDGSREISPETFDVWFDANYSNMTIDATYNADGKPVKVVFSGPYYHCDTVTMTFSNDEKEEKPKVTFEEVTAAIADGFVSPLNNDKKEVKNKGDFETYLETLIEEKGHDIDSTIEIDGHYGFTYRMLISSLIDGAEETKAKIKKTLIEIDFKNGDVFHFLKYIAEGLAGSMYIH